MNIILDTDIGGDTDDLYALLLILNSPELKLDLIITCDEHEGHRKSFAEDILAGMKKNVPVVSGSDLGNEKYCLACKLGTDRSNKQGDVVAAVKQVLEKNDHTVYVSIGPMSNLAKIITALPELKDKFSIVIMGGMLRDEKKPEHNVRYDIPAAQIVLASGISQKWVTSDVTHDPIMAIDSNAPLFMELAHSEKHEHKMLVKNHILFWKVAYPANFFHDPIAVSSIFTDIVAFEKKNVLLHDGGLMEQSPDGHEIEMSVAVKKHEFLKLLHARLGL